MGRENEMDKTVIMYVTVKAESNTQACSIAWKAAELMQANPDIIDVYSVRVNE
jgi:hypothetical protein